MMDGHKYRAEEPPKDKIRQFLTTIEEEEKKAAVSVPAEDDGFKLFPEAEVNHIKHLYGIA